MTETAYLGLGSNLGDRLALLQGAVDLLGAEDRIDLTRCSRVWETVPVGGPEQPDFLNVVVRAEVSLAPLELLTACQRVEAALGRVREVRWGPRTIDVDVLMIDARAIDEPGLVVPHPRMHERAFVLMPLLEVDPDAALPSGTRLVDVRLGPDAVGGVRVFAPPLRLS
ncbi:MAG TPA: 2-amino-4-hydroxy-6-hydroxymethyldihydropteridine diphosphokinase [Actinomycetota bacterium]|nr:2-amino-4-hydroxy-6-hydroxymethyldihydropteridine diphosphokinase [Actinomycetota bacterium]